MQRRSGVCDFADAIVGCIRDVEIGIGVEGDADRETQLFLGGSEAIEVIARREVASCRGDDFGRGRYFSDLSVARISDVDISGCIYSEANRSVERGIGGRASIPDRIC